MKPIYIKSLLIGIVALIALIIILIARGTLPGLRNAPTTRTLAMWGFQPESYFIPSIQAYREKHPNIRITYRQLAEETYEEDLINGIATGRGPDIMMFRNDWRLKHMDKISAMPGTPQDIETILNTFPEIVRLDFATGTYLYALPLYIDTLALLYNIRLFENHAIVFPPQTWEEMASLHQSLTKKNASGVITQYGVLTGGTSEYTTRAHDILTTLLLLHDVIKPTSTLEDIGSSTSSRPAIDTIMSYTSFFLPLSSLQPNSTATLPFDFETFGKENAAMIFGYLSDMRNIQKNYPVLRLGAAPFPSENATNSKITAAHYYGLTVPNLSQNKKEAWEFITMATTDISLSREYLSRAEMPPALKVLIDEYVRAKRLTPFTEQTLIARSWRPIEHKRYQQLFDILIQNMERKSSNIISTQGMSDIIKNFITP